MQQSASSSKNTLNKSYKMNRQLYSSSVKMLSVGIDTLTLYVQGVNYPERRYLPLTADLE